MKLNQWFVIIMVVVVWLALRTTLKLTDLDTSVGGILMMSIFSLIIGIVIYLHITKGMKREKTQEYKKKVTTSFYELIIKVGTVFSYLLGGFSLIFLVILILAFTKNPSTFNTTLPLIVLISSIALGILFILIGRGLQKKRKWVRIPITIFLILWVGYLSFFSLRGDLFNLVFSILAIIASLAFIYYLFFLKEFSDMFS